MKFYEQKIKGVFEILLEPHEDSRGFFMRTFDYRIFKENNIECRWVQENHSMSAKKGTIRGMHFQFPPDGEAKLVRMASGEVFAAYIDLRKGSDTFGKWDSMTLSGNNMIFLPRGFAMGICTLTDNCNMLYKMDNYYNPENQGAIKWDDPDIGIKWPTENPILSARDKNAQSFKEFMAKQNLRSEK